MSTKKVPLTIILKTKNEPQLIESWIKHHSTIVGVENLVIFDHSSTSPEVLAIYKKYGSALNVITIPPSTSREAVHNTHISRDLYSPIKSRSYFFTLLDSDEFLCMDTGTKLTTDGLLETLQQYNHLSSLSTTWLHNCYDKDQVSPAACHIFDIRPKQMIHNLANGKAIFRFDKKQQTITHNKAVADHTITTPFILLHLKNRNISDRIRSQINYCITENILPAHTSQEEMLEILKSTTNPPQQHPLKEIIAFYENETAYRKSLEQCDAHNTLTSSILAHTLQGKENAYDFQSTHFTSLRDAIKQTYPQATPLWKKPGVQLE